jgi:hypothetical protein
MNNNINMQIENPTIFRKNITDKLNSIIKNKKISLNLEKGIFNYSIKTAKEKNVVRKWENKYFVTIYVDKFRSIIRNLDKKNTVGNKSLLKRLKKKEFKAHELAFMKHHQLFRLNVIIMLLRLMNQVQLMIINVGNVRIVSVHFISYKLDQRMNQ